MTCRLFNKKTYITLFVVYLAAVAFLCFMKPDDMPEIQKDLFGIPMDKVAHFLMFLPYPILGAVSFMHKETGIWRNLAVLAVIAIVGAGLAYGTEVIQAQTDYRAYEITDFVADMTGIATGTLLTAAGLIIQKTRL